jgi:hypothetical protein
MQFETCRPENDKLTYDIASELTARQNSAAHQTGITQLA